MSNKNVIIPNGCDALLNLRQANSKKTLLLNENLIHIISDINVLILAYELIKSNPGNMTPGSTEITLDGINLDWFTNLSKELLAGRFQFAPARRKLIPKPGKTTKRPLGIASRSSKMNNRSTLLTSPRDKIVQKAIQLVFEAIYEPSFSDNSHGFRPGRGTHSALKQAKNFFQGVHWVIEADISKCFDTIDHSILLEILRKRINCVKTLTLIKRSLEAGYIDLGKFVSSKLGTPQGSVLSPLLCNIFMDQLDSFMFDLKRNFDKGLVNKVDRSQRKTNPEYKRIWRQGQNLTDPALMRKFRQRLRSIPSKSPIDDNLRRLFYVRYADDFIVGVVGRHSDAVELREKIYNFLKNQLRLELNLEKSKITHFRIHTFVFLGTTFKTNGLAEKWVKTIKRDNVTRKIRVTLPIRLSAPIERLLERATTNGFLRKIDGIYKPTSVGRLINLDHADILRYYNQVIRGIVNYYSFADNLSKIKLLVSYLQMSCALTLRKKYKMSYVAKVFKKFGTNCTCPDSKISLENPDCKRTNNFLINPPYPDAILQKRWSSKLTRSNLTKVCLVCGKSPAEMHHVRQIKDLKSKYRNDSMDFWTLQLAAINRKQIPLCREHHMALHHDTLSGEERTRLKEEIEKFCKKK